MKYVLMAIVATTAMFLSGCSFVDYSVSSSEVGYIYQEDINDSLRANPGSDYVVKLPFEPDYTSLYVDYGVKETKFKSKYTIYGEETRINLPVNATIVHRLKRNPKDNGSLQFKDDEYVKYWASLVSGSKGVVISSEQVYNRMMVEIQDTAFRDAFRKKDENGNLVYDSFDSVEIAIPDIREYVSEALKKEGEQHKLEIVAVRIDDLEVPDSIADARAENLRLQQAEINQTLEIEMQLRLAAKNLVKRVREAINDITVDQLIANQVDKGYLMIKVFQEAAENGGLSASFTPDFMRYVEKDTSKEVDSETLKESRKMYEQLRGMTNDEMMNYFMETQSPADGS